MMNDPERERLEAELAELETKRVQLVEELVHLAARVQETRKKFGNPFYYSHPEEPDEGIANYTANASHEAGMPTFQEFMRVERKLKRVRAELRRLEDDASPR